MLEQKTIAKNVKHLRMSMRETQEEFSERCDISVYTLSNIERARFIPKSETLAKISENTGVPISDLLYSKE